MGDGLALTLFQGLADALHVFQRYLAIALGKAALLLEKSCQHLHFNLKVIIDLDQLLTLRPHLRYD